MILAIFVDLLLLGIIAFGVYYGVTKGFVSMAVRPFKTVASLAFAYFCCPWFSDLVVAPIIRAPITGYVSDFMYKNMSGVTPETAAGELPTLLKMAAAAFNVNIGEGAVSSENYLDALIGTVTDPVVNVISVAISAIVLFLLGRLLFNLAFFLLNKFCNAGLLGKINKTLGMIFGIFIFVLISWGLAVLLSLIFNLSVFDGNELISSFEGFILYKFFNAFNPLELLLSF